MTDFWENLSPAEYTECTILLGAWFEDQKNAEQGTFARARWVVKKLAKSLGLYTMSVSDDPSVSSSASSSASS